MKNSYASIGQRLENKEELVIDIRKRNTPKFQAKYFHIPFRFWKGCGFELQ